jgi:hypothetical protein
VPEFRVGYDISTDKLDALYQKLKPKVGEVQVERSTAWGGIQPGVLQTADNSSFQSYHRKSSVHHKRVLDQFECKRNIGVIQAGQ